MSILLTELNLYKSKTVSTDSLNGGRRSATKIVSGKTGNCFDYILPDELTDGFTRTAKLFFHVDNDDDLPLMSAQVILNAPTDGDDWAVIYEGTPRDTQGDHTSPRLYGVATVAVDALAGSSTISGDVEDASITGIFADGDTVYVFNKATATATTGTREKHTVSGTPTVSGNRVTVTISGTLASDYTVASGARIASAIDCGTLACSVDNWVWTGSGTYDNSTYPLVTDNLGTVEQTWTFEWLTSTTFSCTGDTVGALADGQAASDYSPINPDTGKPYFTLRAAGHGGTPVAGDTLVCQTHGAETAFYLQLTGPAGATVSPGNRISPILFGAGS
jgi:hypothetical protein